MASDDRSLSLALGGETCRVTCPDNLAAIAALAHDLPDFVSEGKPTVSFTIEFDRTLQRPGTPGWKAFHMERREGGIVAEGPSHWVWISSELDRVEARIFGYFQVGTVLRLGLYTILPLRRIGFLTHAAAVVNGEGAYLFPGLSGAGKSTVVANSPGKRCLTEESAVLRRVDGRFQVYGFPLWARLDSLCMIKTPTPVIGMFLLKKGSPKVRPVRRSEALKYLLQNVCFPLKDRESRDCVLETCSRFLDEVPAAELEFGKSPEFWRCIERG